MSASTPPSSAKHQSASAGLTTTGVCVVVGVPTVVLAVLSGWLFEGLGWFFNLVFLLVTVYAAVRVRRTELLAAVIVPPLAYALGILCATPSLSTASGGAIVRFGSTLGEYLSIGAPWLIGSTLLAFVIIIVRGRTGR